MYRIVHEPCRGSFSAIVNHIRCSYLFLENLEVGKILYTLLYSTELRARGTMGQCSRDSWDLQWGPLGTLEESSCNQDYWVLQWGPFGTALRDNGAAVKTCRAMEPAVGTIR